MISKWILISIFIVITLMPFITRVKTEDQKESSQVRRSARPRINNVNNGPVTPSENTPITTRGLLSRNSKNTDEKGSSRIVQLYLLPFKALQWSGKYLWGSVNKLKNMKNKSTN